MTCTLPGRDQLSPVQGHELGRLVCCAAGGAQAMERSADGLGPGIFNSLHCLRFPNLKESPPRQALGKGHADQWAGNREEEIKCTLGQNLISKFQSS